MENCFFFFKGTLFISHCSTKGLHWEYGKTDCLPTWPTSGIQLGSCHRNMRFMYILRKRCEWGWKKKCPKKCHHFSLLVTVYNDWRRPGQEPHGVPASNPITVIWLNSFFLLDPESDFFFCSSACEGSIRLLVRSFSWMAFFNICVNCAAHPWRWHAEVQIKGGLPGFHSATPSWDRHEEGTAGLIGSNDPSGSEAGGFSVEKDSLLICNNHFICCVCTHSSHASEI